MFYIMIFSIFVCLYSIYNYFSKQQVKHIEKKVEGYFVSGFFYLAPCDLHYNYFKEGDLVKGSWKNLFHKGKLKKQVERTTCIKDNYYLISLDGYYVKIHEFAWRNISFTNKIIESNWKKI